MTKDNADNIHSGHRQRLKDRFLNEGLENFPDHNILELVLFYSNKRQDTNETAHRLINKFGSFSSVCDAPIESLCEVKGVGTESARFLKLIPELARAYETGKTKNILCIDSPEKAIKYFTPRFIGKTNEILMVAFLDGQGALLNCRTMAEGSEDTVVMDINKIMVEALGIHARGVILAHNHPQGFCSPSAQDIKMTDNLAKLLKEVKISLCDHLIFSKDDVCRMSEYAASVRDYYVF